MPRKSLSKKVSKKSLFSMTVSCDWVIKISLYALVFLLPLFFAPWTYEVGDFNKQALLIGLSFIGLVAWMVKVVATGSFAFKMGKISVALGVFVLISALSTLFSVSRYSSFWGANQLSSQAFITLVALAIVFFLVDNTFTEKEIIASCSILGISSAVALFYGILQLCGLYLIPLNFTHNNYFNTIGSFGSFGFFAAVVLPFFLLCAVFVKKSVRPLYVANIILIALVLLLLNYGFLWWLCLIGSSVIIIIWLVRQSLFDSQWLMLPMFFFFLSLFFLIFSPSISWLPSNPVEVTLSQTANVAIAAQSLKSLPALGSGPGTFLYDFSKYKSKDFNQTSLWNLNINAGSSKMLTAATEIGILGFLALLALLMTPLFLALRHIVVLTFKRQNPLLVVAVFALLVSQTVGFFLHTSNLSLDFMYFFSLGMLAALLSKDAKTYSFSSSLWLKCTVIGTFIMIFFCGGGVIFLEGQRYVNQIYYRKALVAFSEGRKDESLSYLKKAAADKHNDLYLNQLSLFSLSRLQEELSDQNAVKSLVLDALGASNDSVTLHPEGYENWLTRGYVCQSLIGLTPAATDCALQSYEKAISLNPTNPYLLSQKENIQKIIDNPK